jgi:hypothetical protein
MRRLLSYGGAFVLTFLVLACGSGSPTGGGATPSGGSTTSAPEATAAPAGPARVGDRVESGGVTLTVVKVEKKAELSQFQKAKAGNTFVVAEVLLENVSADKAPHNPFYFRVKDADGFEYNTAIGADQSLQSGDLAKGDKARGNVAFEVKEASKGLVLEYKPIVIGGGDAIRVALE